MPTWLNASLLAVNNFSSSAVQETVLQEPTGPKRIGRAYVLLLLFGGLGFHRFYLRRTGSAVVMLALVVTYFVLLAVFWRSTSATELAGLVALTVVVWEVVDLFLIPRMTRAVNRRIRAVKFEAAGQSAGGRP